MRHLMQAVLLTLTLGAGMPIAALAQSNQGRISLDMRATQGGPSVCQINATNEKRCRLPSGAKELYLVLTYQDLPSNVIYVDLQDDTGGQIIFSRSAPLSGSGTVVYRVTGTDVYNEYVGQLVAKSGQLVSVLGDSSLTPFGRMVRAATLDTPLMAIINQLQRFPLDDNARGQLNTARTHLEATHAWVLAVLNTSMTSEAQQQAVQAAQNEAGAANTIIQALQPSLVGRSDLAFPDVAAGRTQTARLLRNGSPAETLEWTVGDQPARPYRLFLPHVARTRLSAR